MTTTKLAYNFNVLKNFHNLSILESFDIVFQSQVQQPINPPPQPWLIILKRGQPTVLLPPSLVNNDPCGWLSEQIHLLSNLKTSPGHHPIKWKKVCFHQRHLMVMLVVVLIIHVSASCIGEDAMVIHKSTTSLKTPAINLFWQPSTHSLISCFHSYHRYSFCLHFDI